MKKVGIALAVVLAAMMSIAQEKTVVVNMIDLVRFHPSRERDRKLMENMEKDFQEKLDRRRERFEQLRDDLTKVEREARNPALSERARTEAETKVMRQREVVGEAENDLRQEFQNFQRQLADQDTRLLREVTNDIREKVTEYAKSNKITIVMDGSTLAYFDQKLDATDDVLKLMQVDPKVRKAADTDAK